MPPLLMRKCQFSLLKLQTLKIFLLSFAVLFCIHSYSQDTTLVVNKKFKQGTLPKSYRAFTTIDENSGELHLTLVDNKSVERYIIDSNWKIINQFSLTRGAYTALPDRRFGNMCIVGAGQKEFGIYSIDDKKFEINQIDFINKTETNVSELDVSKKESIISGFTTANVFCLITASKKNSELHIISNAKNGGLLFDTITVTLNIISKRLSAAKLMNDAPIIGPGEQSIDKLAAGNKIYYSGSTIYISNEHHDATYITEVNLKTGSIKKKIFKQQLEGDMPEAIIKGRFNSFLHNNILVNGNLYNSELSISFYDYNSGDLIKNYVASENDTMDFKNSAIVFKKKRNNKDNVLGFNINSPSIFGGSRELQLRNTKQFIKKALKGELVFALADKGKDQIELLVESYYEPKSGGGGGFSPGMPGGSFSTPGGVVTMPSTPGHFTGYGFSNSSVKKNVHFKCIFQPGTFEHIENGNEVKSIAELVGDELDDDNKSVISIFRKDHFLYLGFYEKKSEAYIIKRMGEIVED